MNIVFLGPPGSGKGTQAARLAEDLSVPHIGTGDLIREEIASETPLGQGIREVVQRGDLISDDQLMSLLSKRISRKDAREGFILDGTPRSKAQAQLLEQQVPVDLAVLIDVPDNVVADRITSRWVCPQDHKEYNTRYAPPKQPGECDLCGTRLVQRPDDTEEGIARRLKIYHEQTEPIIDHYEGRLLRVDGDQGIEEVSSALRKAINDVVNK